MASANASNGNSNVNDNRLKQNAARVGTTASDWRKEISQAQRSQEVHDISKVLSALEPGSTPAQKLMLAMRFEDQFFQTCSSHEEYRKKLMKRLKKLQKTYKPPPPTPSATPANAAGLQGSGVMVANNNGLDMNRQKDIKLEAELRTNYGDKMIFIIENAPNALFAMKKRQGENGASLLKKHIDNVAQWAVETGTLPESYLFYGGERRRRGYPRAPNYLDQVKKFLGQTINTIRCNVMKLIDPDRYLEEEFLSIGKNMNEHIIQELKHAVISLDNNAPGISNDQRKKLYDKAIQYIPLPPKRKNQTNESDNHKKVVFAHITKIRSAADVIASIIAMKDKYEPNKEVLQKMHTIAKEELDYIQKNCCKIPVKNKDIILEDVWNKEIKSKSTLSSYNNNGEDTSISLNHNKSLNSSKRQKLSDAKIVLKSKILFTPGRKISSNLVHELKSKQAQYLRPTSNGAGARLRMIFGKAFEITIFLSPLLVNIRALSLSSDNNNQMDEDVNGSRANNHIVENGSFPTGRSPMSALQDTKVLFSFSKVVGSFSNIGCIVAERLEYASANATYILRRYFADFVGPFYEKENCSDFEIEVAETSALLSFLQLIKDTFSIDESQS